MGNRHTQDWHSWAYAEVHVPAGTPWCTAGVHKPSSLIPLHSGHNPKLSWNRQASRPELYPSQLGSRLELPQGKDTFIPLPQDRCQMILWVTPICPCCVVNWGYLGWGFGCIQNPPPSLGQPASFRIFIFDPFFNLVVPPVLGCRQLVVFTGVPGFVIVVTTRGAAHHMAFIGPSRSIKTCWCTGCAIVKRHWEKKTMTNLLLLPFANNPGPMPENMAGGRDSYRPLLLQRLVG